MSGGPRNALIPELAVSDIAASLRFYTEVLGFAVVYDRPAEGFALLRLEDNELMLDQLGVGRDWAMGALERPFGRGVNLQMRVSALEPILQRLEKADVALFLAPEHRVYEIGGQAATQHQFVVGDPDGYLLRFCA
ncbi:MAG: VOC family protein [Devosia sp.]